MRRKWLIGLVVLVALVGMALWLARNPEPSYQGRTASAWLDLQEIPGAGREHVIAGFKAMGRDAAPFLARELEWKPTWLYDRLWALKYRSRLPAWLKQRIPESKDRRASAALVFPNLGPDAEPALPHCCAFSAQRIQTRRCVTACARPWAHSERELISWFRN